MYMVIISILINLTSLFIRVLLKLAIFTGLWKGIILLAVSEYIVIPLITNKTMCYKNFPQVYPIYVNTIFTVVFLIMFFTTLKNIIKIFNPNFRYTDLYYSFKHRKERQQMELDSIEKVSFSLNNPPIKR
ncbi:MAG: hypothetical protein RSA91_00515 [Bacilli bacterium]